jgi:hypothetical protein
VALENVLGKFREAIRIGKGTYKPYPEGEGLYSFGGFGIFLGKYREAITSRERHIQTLSTLVEKRRPTIPLTLLYCTLSIDHKCWEPCALTLWFAFVATIV